MKWYLEKDFASTNDLVSVLEKHSIDYEVLSIAETIKIRPNTVNRHLVNLPDDICYGSFKFMYLTYGTFDFHQFEYLSYMNTIYDFLLNNKHLLTTLPHLITHAQDAAKLWSQEMLFIKPNYGLKQFDAQKWHSRYMFILVNEIYAENTTTKDDLIFIFPARDDIKMEFRFVIVDGSVITGSQYQPIIQHHSCCEQGRFAGMYAGAIALRLKDTIRAKAYTIDVAVMNNDEFRIVEINSFNCAGLYDCNFNWIVEELSC